MVILRGGQTLFSSLSILWMGEEEEEEKTEKERRRRKTPSMAKRSVKNGKMVVHTLI